MGMNNREVTQFVEDLDKVYPNNIKMFCKNYAKCKVRTQQDSSCSGNGKITYQGSNRHLGVLILKCEDYKI